ncbi:MAG: HNH endonuclease signature motif containing protein [Planctomycetota bacterium]
MSGQDGSCLRYIPEALRGLVLERSGYRCEYVSPEGYRCEQTTKLQIDHIVPYAKGGPTTSENLRCLCQSHNLWAAEKAFGKELVRGRIAGSGGGDGFIAEASTPGYVRNRQRAARLSLPARVFA